MHGGGEVFSEIPLRGVSVGVASPRPALLHDLVNRAFFQAPSVQNILPAPPGTFGLETVEKNQMSEEEGRKNNNSSSLWDSGSLSHIHSIGVIGRETQVKKGCVFTFLELNIESASNHCSA